MATATKKPNAGKNAAKKPQAKSTQAKAGAGPAIAERSKDAKPAFGKAAPRKVTLAPTAKSAKPAEKPKAPPAKANAADPSATHDGSVATKMARGARTAANVAAGAVVATAKGAASLASSMVGSKGRSKAK